MQNLRHLRSGLLVCLSALVLAGGGRAIAQTANPIIYSVTVPNDPVQPGGVARFVVTLTNNSTDQQAVRLYHTVPQYTTSGSDAAGTFENTGNYIFIAAGASVTRTISFVPLTTTNTTTAPPEGTPLTLTLLDEDRGLSFGRTVIVHAQPVLDLQLATATSNVAAGKSFTYSLACTSLSTVTGVTLSVPVPANAKFVSADGGGKLGSDGVVRWNIASPGADTGGIVHLTLAAGTLSPDQLRLDATLSDASRHVVQSSATMLIDPAVAINYAVSTPLNPVAPGQTLEYDVTLTNNSPDQQAVRLYYTVPLYTTSGGDAAGTLKNTGNYIYIAAGASVTKSFFFNLLTTTNVTTAAPDYTALTVTFLDEDRGTSFGETVSVSPSFFSGKVALSNGVYYLLFGTGNPFGYYSYLSDPHYIYHFDLGYEYVFDAADGKDGVYLYDFKSKGFFYTSPSFPFPYLYDFSLDSVLYYYPDPSHPGRYNTNGIRYFYEFKTGKVITK